jgi:hypothetical protein
MARLVRATHWAVSLVLGRGVAAERFLTRRAQWIPRTSRGMTFV